MSKVFDSTIGALNTSLNLRLMNQNVISANIANADTPGYKAKRVEFEQEFRRALGRTDELPMQVDHPDHQVLKDTDPVNPVVFEDPTATPNLDGNTVNRAQEMAMMAENQQLYETSVELLRKKLGMLKYAVNDGGGSR